MNISKEHVCEAFKNYTDAYDSSDTKIRLKIDHTYRVADNCEKIAESLNLERDDVMLAWLIGMLHDIGRFEQVRRYNTFSDADSIDHAGFGADLLFREDLLKLFVDCGDSADEGGPGESLGNGDASAVSGSVCVQSDGQNMEILEAAIRYHSAYRLPEGLDTRQETFCNIIRDADKIDILKVNTELPIEDIYNVTGREIATSDISDGVMRAFDEKHCILRSLKSTAVDHIVGHISLCYELVYPMSFRLLDEQGCIYRLMDFKSENPKTEEKFEHIRQYMGDFIKNKKISPPPKGDGLSFI